MAPLPVVEFHKAAGHRAEAGVVAQHGDGPEAVFGGVAGLVRERSFDVEVGQGDACARGGEGPGDGEADALGGAGDEHVAVREASHVDSKS